MNKLLLTASMGIFFLNFSAAHATMTIEELLGHPDPLKALTEMETGDPANFKSLCAQIKEPGFYGQAEAAGMGPIKRNKLIHKCSGVSLETGKFKKPEPKEKPAETAREVVQLRHIDLTKRGKTFKEDETNVEEAKEAILENAAQLGKKAEFEEKLKVADDAMQKAKEFYDHLSLIISGLREDSQHVPARIFNVAENREASDEEFLTALEEALKKHSATLPVALKGWAEQIGVASELLKQAKENLERARMEFVAINREMLELTPAAEGGASSGDAAAGGK